MSESSVDRLSGFSDEGLKVHGQNLELEYRRWKQGGPLLYRISFPLCLVGVCAGIGGVMYGAFGNASRGEMQLTFIIILLTAPLWFYIRKTELRAREVNSEYLETLQELTRRNL